MMASGCGPSARLGVLPAGVGGVVEVEQEAFAAVEEAEAEEIVLEEGEGGATKTL